MIRKYLTGMIAGVLAVAGLGAAAANITVKDGAGTAQSLLTFTFNGVQAYGEALIDTTGAQIDPATKQQQVAMTTPLTTLAGTVAATGSPASTAQTVQASALPLPTGAATSANQAPLGAPGALGASGSTVTTVLPQISATAGSAISFGTSAANLFAANASRHFMVIQVQGAPDTTGTNGCYINGTATATADANSLFIARGGYFESATHVGTGAISIICTGTMGVYSRQG